MSSARAATAAMSLSTIGAVEAAAYGPATTSPARICADHMPAKFVAKTVGPQAHPGQAGVDGELFDLLVAVPAKA